MVHNLSATFGAVNCDLDRGWGRVGRVRIGNYGIRHRREVDPPVRSPA